MNQRGDTIIAPTAPRYMDFKKGIDKSETAGDRTLVDGDPVPKPWGLGVLHRSKLGANEITNLRATNI